MEKKTLYQKQYIFFLIILLVGVNAYSQMTEIKYSGLYSEGKFYIKDKILYTNVIVINFKEQVFNPPTGLKIVEQSDIVSKFSGVKAFLQILNERYGIDKIIKQVPNAQWGETTRTNEITGETITLPEFSQLFTIMFKIPVPLDSIINECLSIPEVGYTHQAILFSFFDEPDDERYISGEQWNLAAVQAPKAWDITHGSSSVKIGIVDDGVDYEHVDLNGSINYTDQIIGNHGTEVAGVAGAETDNIDHEGIASLGWGLQLNCFGGIGWILEEDVVSVAQILYDAISSGIKVLNMSWGTYRFTTTEDMDLFCSLCDEDDKDDWEGISISHHNYSLIDTVIQAAIGNNIICIAAAGNRSDNSKYIPDNIYRNLPDHVNCDPCWVPFEPFPAKYGSVIGVSATKWNNGVEIFKDFYNYGDHVDVAAPGARILTTSNSNNYKLVDGTSLSAPLVSALCGLIVTVKPDVTPDQVFQILTLSADKIDATAHPYYDNGRNDSMGYGRINAYQALLYALGYDNKTPNNIPTLWNNQRIIARGKNNSDVLYEVFASGTTGNEEIFFRKSTNNGTSWGDPIRISSGNYGNTCPCISVTDEGVNDGIHVVWQQKISGYSNRYNIYYRRSIDSGSAWETPILLPNGSYVLVSSDQTPGPNPVLTWVTSGSSYRLVLVFNDNTGFHWRYTNTVGSWTTPASDTLRSPSGIYSGSYAWFPSLIGERDFAILTADWRYGSNVHSRKYTATPNSWSTGWANVSTGCGATYNRQSSIVITPPSTSNLLASWCGVKSGYYHVFGKQGYSTNTWSSVCKEFIVSGKDAYYPSGTYYKTSGSEKRAVVYRSSENQVYMSKSTYPFVTWTQHAMGSNTNCSNITHEFNDNLIPRMIWTSGTANPYTIVTSNQNLAKSLDSHEFVYHRKIVAEDKTTGSSMSVELGGIEAVTESGEVLSIDFGEAPPDDFIAKWSDFSDFLTTEPITLPEDVREIRFSIDVNTLAPQDTGKARIPCDFKSFSVAFTAQDYLSGKTAAVSQDFSDPNGWIEFKSEKTIDVTALAGKPVVLKTTVSCPTFKEDNLTFGLGHVYIYGEQAVSKENLRKATQTFPRTLELAQNYPNPFNIQTEIRFGISQTSMVTVKVYDILGHEVASLMHENKEAGYYSVKWDGKNRDGMMVPTGVYICRLTAGDHQVMKKMTLIK